MVISVENNSPAQKAGLVAGDVLVGMNNQLIASIDELHKLLTHDQVGVRSPVTIIRRTEKLILNVVPEESPDGAGSPEIRLFALNYFASVMNLTNQ